MLIMNGRAGASIVNRKPSSIMELDRGSGMKSNHLEVEEQEGGEVGKKSAVGVGVVEVEGLKPEGVSSSAVDMTMKMEDLEGLIKSLSLEDDDPIIKAELISKLEVARVQSANEKKLARKAVWIEEARKEVLAVEEFGKRSMHDVFPELVWKRILENLDSKDKALMSNISLLLRDLLKNEKTTFLFHSVFPLLNPYLPRNSLLNLRKICREWKGSVDSYLQSHDTTMTPFLEGMKPADTNSSFRNIIYRFKGHIDQLAEFIAGYGPDWENPFITRKISLGFQLTYPDPVNPVVLGMLKATYWDRVNNLLGIWGDQIWMAEVLLDMGPNPAVLYEHVWNLLTRMPNLRFLVLDGGVDYYKPPGKRAKDFNKVMERCMMIELPLPDLPFLNTFKCKEIPAPIVGGIVNKCSATLETVSFVEFLQEPNTSIDNTNLPNLKVLRHCANKNMFMTGPTFQVDWPSLQEACVQYFRMEADDVPRIIRGLNQFGSSMTKKLTLHLHKHSGPVGKLSDRALKELSLELPQLEELTLSVCRINLKTMDFILPMTSLKKLTVHYEKRVKNWILEKKNKKHAEPEPGPSSSKSVSNDDNTSTGEIIKFGSYMARLYESNIWKLLPELNQVTIAVVTITLKKVGGDNEDVDKKETKRKDYTREGYKQYWKSTVCDDPTSTHSLCASI